MRLPISLALGLLQAGGTAAPPGGDPPLSARDSAYHVLNRLAFGAAPGQVDRIAREGVMRWIERQLGVSPGSDPALAAREKDFQILSMSTSDLARLFREQRRRRQASAEMAPDSTEPMRGRGRGRNGDNRFRELAGELQELVVVRATYAEHQLAEVMADFWTNHFNVFYGKAADRYLLPEYIERTIRPRSLGSFHDLLVTTAKSPAMLVYLDNAQSVAPGSEPPGPRRRARAAARRPTGINENYARELLELHTLGVDGGYAQRDVGEVARVLTGWSVARFGTGGFQFNRWAHDRGEKRVLGEAFPSGHGEDEGTRLLAMLASHPATMHHLSAKLCERFVADLPPDGCIDDAVRAWKGSNGEIRAVLLAIFRSPDFWAPANIGTKVKTPLEFVVSALRAVGAEPGQGPAAAAAVARLGQPLYLQAAPTGYPETQDDWVNSGALLNRMNLALGIASNKIPGVTVDLDRVVPALADHEALVDRIDQTLLGGHMSARTRAIILREIADLGDPASARTMAVGLALGGPAFQRQ